MTLGAEVDADVEVGDGVVVGAADEAGVLEEVVLSAVVVASSKISQVPVQLPSQLALTWQYSLPWSWHPFVMSQVQHPEVLEEGGAGVGEGGNIEAVVDGADGEVEDGEEGEVEEVEGPGTEGLNCNLLAACVKSPLSVIVAMANQLPE